MSQNIPVHARAFLLEERLPYRERLVMRRAWWRRLGFLELGAGFAGKEAGWKDCDLDFFCIGLSSTCILMVHISSIRMVCAKPVPLALS